MDAQDFQTAPKDLVSQIEKIVRNLPKDEQFELYKMLKSQVGNQRQSQRKTFFNEIVFTSSRGAHDEFSTDICEDGIFIETPIPFAVGERLAITFPIKNKNEHIKLYGTIARKTDNGIGVKFCPVDKTKAMLLKDLLESL
jgi:hypothetical protein